jgi:hypothetical protein
MALRNQKMFCGHAETGITIMEETLSDRSKVYSVIIPEIEYTACNLNDAVKVYEIITNALRNNLNT